MCSKTTLGRRRWLLSGVIASLAGAYGVFAAFAARFLFPERAKGRLWRLFLGFTHELDVGESSSIVLPSGDELLLSNTGRINPDTGSEFLAFSNRCPHLGCKVHWQAQQNRFYCPCHQGVFDPDGHAISGPPADAGKSLKPYQLDIVNQSIYVLEEDA